MSNLDRVVKVGQWWSIKEDVATFRGKCVAAYRNYAKIWARDGREVHLSLRTDGTPVIGDWIRVSRPKVDAAAVERERIAKLHDKAAREFIRSPIPVISGVAHNTALGMSAMLVGWHEDQAMWLREGAK